MTSKVKELVEAAKRAQVLLRAVTVGQVLEEGHAAIEAAGINPYCVNEGRADGSESIGTWWLESAISAVESEGDGWIEIKDGCEMPEGEVMVLVYAGERAGDGGAGDAGCGTEAAGTAAGGKGRGQSEADGSDMKKQAEVAAVRRFADG